MKGTRIRWDGATKVLALGFAAVAAIVALPSLLGGEAPPQPGDVGLARIAPPPPPPAPIPAAPQPPKAKRAAPKRPKKRREPGDRHDRGGPGHDRGRRRASSGERSERGRAAPAQLPAAAAAALPTALYGFAPVAARQEQFGFER